MKVSELRIGNWVVPPETPFEPVPINLKGLEYYGDDLIPIKLTEEWLLRFGFEKSKLNYWMLPNKSFFLGITLNNFIYPMFDTDNWIPIKLEYVHQLQNLYFVFTGEELTIK